MEYIVGEVRGEEALDDGGIDMLSEELLKQAAEELALALVESLPEPEQCQHQFSEDFERKLQLLLSSVPPNTKIAVVAPEPICN